MNMLSSLDEHATIGHAHPSTIGDHTGVVIAGSGTPIVLLHASLGSKSQWTPLVRRLAVRNRVIALDLYGYGDHAVPAFDAPFTLDDEVRFVAERIDRLVDPRLRVHVIGHSYGGLVALRFAQSRRDRVASLSVYEPVVFRMLDDEAEATVDVTRIASRVADLVAAGHRHDAARIFVDFWNGEGSFAAMSLPAQVAIARRVDKVPLDFRAASCWPLDPESVRAIDAPTLLLGGKRSPAVVRRIGERLARTLPNRWLASFDTGHMGPITDSGRINPWFESFVDFCAERDAAPRALVSPAPWAATAT